jgi:hypothetical protein
MQSCQNGWARDSWPYLDSSVELSEAPRLTHPALHIYVDGGQRGMANKLRILTPKARNSLVLLRQAPAISSKYKSNNVTVVGMRSLAQKKFPR